MLLSGRQNIALRGYNETDKDKKAEKADIQCKTKNPGNFRALFKYRVDRGDVTLREYFNNAPKNATYKSKTVQNELISIIGNQILDNIIKMYKKTKPGKTQ